MSSQQGTLPGTPTANTTTGKVPRFSFSLPLPIYLSVKEILRNKGRFALIAMVIALVTTLVLFIDGLAEGLGNGNIAFLSKLNGELVIFQNNTDLAITASQLPRSLLRQTQRIEGIKDVGSLGFSNASVYLGPEEEQLKIALIGVEPGKPGMPPVLEGQTLVGKQQKGVVIDSNVAQRANLGVGDEIVIKSIQGTDEEFFTFPIVGIAGDQQYFLQPSIFLPYVTWDRIRPQADPTNRTNYGSIFNIAVVQLDNPSDIEGMATVLEDRLGSVEVADIETTYQAAPGYSAQQSTLNTQRIFTMLIGALVIGGFFQIQTLQKIGQIGMLKAIGAKTRTIVISFLLQIVLITVVGVFIGGAGTLLLSLGLPPVVPISFTMETTLVAITSLILIGPLAGIVSLRILLKVEPLTALGLSS